MNKYLGNSNMLVTSKLVGIMRKRVSLYPDVIKFDYEGGPLARKGRSISAGNVLT